MSETGPPVRYMVGAERQCEEMNQYMLLLTGGDFAEMSPAESQAALQKYFDWNKKLRAEGAYVGGDELEMTGKKIGPAPDFFVSDGPFAESNEAVGGYYVIQAESLEAAIEISKGCPHLIFGGAIELRPIIDHSGGS